MHLQVPYAKNAVKKNTPEPEEQAVLQQPKEPQQPKKPTKPTLMQLLKRLTRRMHGSGRPHTKPRTHTKPRIRLNSLRARLTILYTLLLTFLLGLVSLAALFMLQRSLLGGLDEALADTNRQFVGIVSQLALDDPATQKEREQLGFLPRARYMFANDLIQVERLEFFNHQTLLTALRASAATPILQESLLMTLRELQHRTRRIATGLPDQHPIELSDQELIWLIQSPTGRLIIERNVPLAFQDKAVPYRILVTLGNIDFSTSTVGFAKQPTLAITYVGRSVGGIQDTIQRLQNVFLFLLFSGLLLAGMGAFVLAGRALRPLQQVRQAAERIGGRTLTERVPEPDSGDEVQALAHSLNKMLERLEGSFEAQRRFTSDASHELRTPVTAISGHASYLLRRTDPSTLQQESLHIIKDESERLSNLIGSLLDLARSDGGVLTLNKGPILSGHFLHTVVRELEPLAQAQNTELSVQGEDILFEADPDRLKQVLINLVSNALKAGAQTIKLISVVTTPSTSTTSQTPSSLGHPRQLSKPQAQTAVAHPSTIKLTVEDDGPGIPKEHLQRLFDRFYRVQDSRSRDKGGAGLGLSIVQGIVSAHAGQIWLESELGVGTSVHVKLPIGDLPMPEDEDIP